MHVLGRFVPLSIVLSSSVALCLLLALVVARATGPADAGPLVDDAGAAAPSAEPAVRRQPAPLPPPPPPPPAPDDASWSGFAFDACRAPSQRVMDRWRTASPFTGVGIYLGGIHRACEQRHLSPAWVTRQLRSGWKLLPIWVGPQASCTGYDHRITGRPGRFGRYPAARARAVREARAATRTARQLRLPAGEVLFYDIEPFDVRKRHCRGSSLAFLDQWTREVHRLGYRSGVYSHVNSAIALLSRTRGSYARPDAVWYAWIDRVGSMPGEHVARPDFMRTSRVHQYALDTRVEFGGIRMAIDWNFVSLGATSRAYAPPSCDRAAGRIDPRPVRKGARGTVVRVLQCLVLPGRPHPVKASGRFDLATHRAVRAFQARQGLTATGTVDRRTWTSLLARGKAPVLRKGARGDSVRRLQRSLNAAAGRRVVRVDGAYGRETAQVVRHYRARVGLGPKGVANRAVWHALNRGRVLPPGRR
ncbi:MAG TPA: glycoside hydrolase domain-containing protein [Nocardioides sp.]|nr:glycoside hydrolase domain-containing protein [Nocardioides sp.]